MPVVDQAAPEAVKLPDPNDPRYAAARAKMANLFFAIGREDSRNGYGAMADDLMSGDLMQVPTWIALGMLAEAASLPCKSGEGAGESALVNELRAVARAMELVDFHAREPDLDLKPSACRAIVKDAIAALTPDATQTREAEGEADVGFLLARSGHAGKCMFGGKRWTGMSSNALVSIAFGETDEGLPSDSSDLAACYRTVMRLPQHRRIDGVFDHLEAGERHVESKYEGSIKWAREDTQWPGRAALNARDAA